MSQSNWSGRTSRTLNEGFGPYCNQAISEYHTPMPSRDRWLVGAVLCVFALWVALMLTGVIA